ncbi:MAG: dodecin domain-containing protein [Methanospirillaceae archaeon]|nr:dodecin domain-containing protein [Methanospirillaceae archaeon]
MEEEKMLEFNEPQTAPFIELIGSSTKGWEGAAANAVMEARKNRQKHQSGLSERLYGKG